MSHIDVDIFEFLILTLIPVAALFIIEMICRAVKVQSWPKLTVQGQWKLLTHSQLFAC